MSLQLYKNGEFQLVFDMHPNRPSLALTPPQWRLPKPKTVPLSLFLNSHAKNKRLIAVNVIEELGRVVDFVFANRDQQCVVRAILIPRQPNLIAITDEKKISWNKPKDLAPAQPQPSLGDENARDWSEYTELWLQQRSSNSASAQKAASNLQELGGSASAKDPQQKQIEKNIEKKKRAMATIESELSLEEEKKWQEFGQFLKTAEPISDQWRELYDGKINRSQNMEKAFQRSKDLRRKKQGTLDRLEKLKQEVAELEHALKNPESAIASAVVRSREGAEKTKSYQMMKDAQIKGRTLKLDEETEAVIGKSGTDNLKLLREARAWDLWLHLRDYPGSHAIIFKAKNKNLSHAQLQQVAIRLAEASVKNAKGLRLDVVMAECRYVRPVKGAKAGLVTFQNEKVFTITVPA